MWAGLIRGRDDEALRRPAEDGWSALEAVCHLRDIDDISLLRFRMMLHRGRGRVDRSGSLGARPPVPTR